MFSQDSGREAWLRQMSSLEHAEQGLQTSAYLGESSKNLKTNDYVFVEIALCTRWFRRRVVLRPHSQEKGRKRGRERERERRRREGGNIGGAAQALSSVICW